MAIEAKARGGEGSGGRLDIALCTQVLKLENHLESPRGWVTGIGFAKGSRIFLQLDRVSFEAKPGAVTQDPREPWPKVTTVR